MSREGIDLNPTPKAGQSSVVAAKKQRRIADVDMPLLVNLFDGMTGELPSAS
jgi:hypothetical protein